MVVVKKINTIICCQIESIMICHILTPLKFNNATFDVSSFLWRSSQSYKHSAKKKSWHSKCLDCFLSETVVNI